MTGKRNAIIALIAAAALVCGCLPAPERERAPGFAAGAAEAPPAGEYARARYRKNRMVPPAHFAVSPKPPRNNEFGEFDENLYTGLGSQPSLPPLPGDLLADISAMAAPETGMPLTTAPAGFFGGAAAGSSAETFSANAYSAPSAGAPRGISANGEFFPVEQLVYGGANGEADSPDAYRLQPRDVILVTVRGHPEFSGALTLQADGAVRVPNTPDPIAVRGMTAPEAADEIRRNLAVYVRGECVVRVQTNRARGGHYFVFGDVRRPGRFPMGMEEIRLADAVMAANFETNPARLDPGEELTPAFPASSPLGASLPPETADMARVMLITPHRSQPARSTHDLRRALLGRTADNPLVRPGQIVVVPSLDPEKNFALGLEMPDMSGPPAALMPGQGFSTASSPARLAEVLPYAQAPSAWGAPPPEPAIEANLRRAYAVQANEEPPAVERFPGAAEGYAERRGEIVPGGTVSGEIVSEEILPEEYLPEEYLTEYPAGGVVHDVESVHSAPARGRRLRKAPFATVEESVVEVSPSARRSLDGWKKGF